MRIVAATVAAFLLMSANVMGEGAGRGLHIAQSVERSQQPAAHIVVRDPRWQLSDALAFHGVTQAVCEGCPDGQIGGAYLWLHSADRNISDDELDRALSESVILRLVWDPFMLSGIQPRPETEIVPVSLSGLTGRARVFGIKNREGGMQHVIALSVAKDCLSLDGILFAKDGVAIAIDRLDGFVRAIGVERNQADFCASKRPPEPPNEFPLGDAFRRRYID
jgi:hypothetical protein